MAITSWLPDSPRPAAFNIKSNYQTLVSDPITGAHKRQTRSIGGHYWSVELVYNPMRPSEFGAIQAFLEQQRGRHDSFGVFIPNFADQTGFIPGNLLMSTGHDKVYRVVDGGTADNLDHNLTGLTTNGGNTYSNDSFVLSNSVPVAIYLDFELTSGSYPQMALTSNKTSDTYRSDPVTLREGRQVHCLTPYVNDTGAHVEIIGTNFVINELQIRHCVQLSSGLLTVTPTPLAADEDDYLVPGPITYMRCSINNDVQTIQYAKDGFVRIELDLIERLV